MYIQVKTSKRKTKTCATEGRPRDALVVKFPDFSFGPGLYGPGLYGPGIPRKAETQT